MSSLKDLEKDKLVTLQKGLGGFYSDADLLHASPNELFLEDLEITNKGDLKLMVKTKGGSLLNTYTWVKGLSSKRLNQIKTFLEKLKGKSLDEVYSRDIIE